MLPVWADLAGDQRDQAQVARMANWRAQRFGVFVHWGPYSLLGGSYKDEVYPGNTEWIMRTAKISRDDYRNAATQFDPSSFDAEKLVNEVKGAGARYLIFTAKHYDGYALFDSKASDFDSVDVMPSKRDIIAEVSKACRSEGVPLGFSYALDRDWYHPGGNTLGPPWDPSQSGGRDRYLSEVALPQIQELCSNYGAVFALHAHAGDGFHPNLRSSFSSVVDANTVMPWAFTGRDDYSYSDSAMRGHQYSGGDWEKCRTLGNSWGYRQGRVKWETPGEILKELISTASMGGNYLLNVGLDGEGRIPPEAQAILDETGQWLSQYGESIYGTSRSPFLRHPWNGVATLKRQGEDGCFVYLHLFSNPGDQLSLEGLLPEPSEAQLLGSEQMLSISGHVGAWTLDTGSLNFGDDLKVIRLKLNKAPEMGRGPVVERSDRSFLLELGRGSYSDARTQLGRSESSAELRLTSFRDEKETGTWQIFSKGTKRVRLKITASSDASFDGSHRLIVKVGGEAPVEWELFRSSDSRATQAGALLSPELLLPSGLSTLDICGPTTQEGESAQSPITLTSLQLIPLR
ncbi:alpha-L-fucosidase [Haloferula luteola]|uniref:alpha-L-fucosidase n=1 Tax=Haloferula luteola TaxID=595692 RepID=A0A840VHJ6_9BACT|nr:alpha-L-fucosidase [Haloferula luteola]